MSIDLRNDPFYRLLIALEQNGRADPNVSLFLGVLTDSVERVQRAIDDGASVNITDGAVIDYHRGFLQVRYPDLLTAFEFRNKEDDSK